MDTTPVLKQYYETCESSFESHGNDTVCFIQIGSFYEAYGFQDSGIDIHSVAELLRPIVVSKKDKNKESSLSNPWFIGIPCHASAKYISQLTDNGYTVVCIDQISSPSKKIERKITRVYSPGVPVECKGDSNSIMCVLYEKTRLGACASISVMDVVTGETWCGEYVGMDDDEKLALDGILSCCYRWLPKETVFIGDQVPDKHPVFLNCGCIRFGDRLTSLQQTSIIVDVLPIPDMLTPRDYLGISKSCFETLSTILNFAWQRDETSIKGVTPPMYIDKTSLDIQSTSMRQLDIIGGSEGNLLQSLLNPKTAGGRRLLHQRLSSPSTNVEEINARLDKVDEFVSNNNYDKVRQSLGKTIDVERLLKILSKGLIKPSEWFSMKRTLDTVTEICNLETSATSRDIENTLCESKCDHTITSNVFCESLYEDIDMLEQEMESELKKLKSLCDTLNNISGCIGEDKIFKLIVSDSVTISTTLKRFEKAKKEIKHRDLGINGKMFPGKELSHRKTTSSSQYVIVYHDSIDQVTVTFLEKRDLLIKLVSEKYREFCKYMYETHKDNIRRLGKLCGEIDVAATCAKISVDMGHTRPEITQGPAKFKASVLRHPIVESQDLQEQYIGNDIDLSSNMLLYGVNSSGKSCLMKSIGIAIIMAQAGMFVACSKLELSPYKRVFTRIWNNDNIFKGQSTFVTEMMEFLDIMRRACSDSLVLGDELCSGTEDDSAAGIVAQGLIDLTERKCDFIFATHMHRLVEIPEIDKLERLRVCHLGVHYDRGNSKLVYDRILRDGPGEKSYGIEVLKGLGFPDEFITGAYKFRRSVTKELDPENMVAHRPSRYNSKVNVITCHYCGKRAKHTHHIEPQETAEPHVKNRQYNLQPVCEKCHHKIHDGKPFEAFRFKN